MGRSHRIAALLLLSLGLTFASVPSSTYAVDDEIPTCEDVFTCVVFDPSAAAPGTTVTITPDPVSSDGFIPIVSERPPEGGLLIGIDTGTASVSSSLVGDDQMASFVAPICRRATTTPSCSAARSISE